MAGTKISDLPSASTLSGAELVPVVQSDVTKKTTVADILASSGAGTVTSVNVSGGTTGLTATGGPITTSGTITLGGTLDVDNGGTGATTAANARTNLDVPSRAGSGASGTWSINVTGNAGTVTDGIYSTGSYSNPSWITSLAGSKVTGNISGNAGNVTGTVLVANGGTSATTASGARTNLLPSYTSNAGKVLAVNSGASDVEWISASGTGTVTSVNVSGGSTGLTTSGGPVTSSGTITLAGTLAVGYGGTGATTAPNARINLLPSYAGNNGKVLALNSGGTDTEWIAAGGTGTVTSVDVSGGSTGLTFTGGPITGAGTITAAGTLGYGYGGTGNTVAPTAGSIVYGDGTKLTYSAVGTAGQYLQSNGSGAPTWSSISSGVGSTAYYGAFSDTTDQTIASTTTAYVVAIGTTDESNGVSITSGNRITFANAGTYSIIYSIQLDSADTSIHDVDIWLRKNGSDVTGTNSQFSVPNKHGSVNGHLIAVCNYVLTVAAGDYLQLAWSATSLDISIQTYAAGTSPTRPTTPGVIVTAAQLTQIGIGYYGLTSTSSVAIGTGTKTFTTNLNAMNTAFTVGSRVRVAYPPDPTYFMEGNITAFSGTTLTISADVTGGSGTLANWSFTSVGSAGVTSISGGSTGLTPATATTGAVTLAGTVNVANGGTGLTSGTSGGVLYYSATGTIASSGLLVANALVVGGGAGVAPSTITTGTGVVTALGVNTGSAGAFVVNGGALGTPSSGTVTNLTGTASININGTVGATTPTTGAFTTVAASSTVTLSGLTASTALALDASKNVVSVTNTGTGNNVLATSPTLTTPILGTPTSGNLSNCTADGTNSVGYRNIPQSGSDKTSSYTLATTDVGKFIGVGTSGSIVVPNSTFAAGDVVSIFNNTSGSITITTNPTSSYIAGANTTKASVSLATRGVATILFISGTVCVISGNVS